MNNIRILCVVLVLLLGVILIARHLRGSVDSGVNALGSSIVSEAEQLSSQLTGARSTFFSFTDPNPVLQAVIKYWNSLCGGTCSNAYPGNVQCVAFVYGVFGALGIHVSDQLNGNEFWGYYAHQPGWQEIPAGSGGLPQPGDIVAWTGGQFGHVAIATSVTPASATKPGNLTVAESNAPGNIYSPQTGSEYMMPLLANGSVVTWPGYQVQGFIRYVAASKNGSAPNVANVQQILKSASPLAARLKNLSTQQMQWVSLAIQDAKDFAPSVPPSYTISQAYFVAQIFQESGFQNTSPNGGLLTSSAAAVGIAQFLPSTAAGIPTCIGVINSSSNCAATNPAMGINLNDPVQALRGAAYLMLNNFATYIVKVKYPPTQQQFMTAYEQALAAYNAGGGTVNGAIANCGQNWLSCTPAETQNYVNSIVTMAAGA